MSRRSGDVASWVRGALVAQQWPVEELDADSTRITSTLTRLGLKTVPVVKAVLASDRKLAIEHGLLPLLPV